MSMEASQGGNGTTKPNAAPLDDAAVTAANAQALEAAKQEATAEVLAMGISDKAQMSDILAQRILALEDEFKAKLDAELAVLAEPAIPPQAGEGQAAEPPPDIEEVATDADPAIQPGPNERIHGRTREERRRIAEEMNALRPALDEQETIARKAKTQEDKDRANDERDRLYAKVREHALLLAPVGAFLHFIKPADLETEKKFMTRMVELGWDPKFNDRAKRETSWDGPIRALCQDKEGTELFNQYLGAEERKVDFIKLLVPAGVDKKIASGLRAQYMRRAKALSDNIARYDRGDTWIAQKPWFADQLAWNGVTLDLANKNDPARAIDEARKLATQFADVPAYEPKPRPSSPPVEPKTPSFRERIGQAKKDNIEIPDFVVARALGEWPSTKRVEDLRTKVADATDPVERERLQAELAAEEKRIAQEEKRARPVREWANAELRRREERSENTMRAASASSLDDLRSAQELAEEKREREAMLIDEYDDMGALMGGETTEPVVDEELETLRREAYAPELMEEEPSPSVPQTPQPPRVAVDPEVALRQRDYFDKVNDIKIRIEAAREAGNDADANTYEEELHALEADYDAFMREKGLLDDGDMRSATFDTAQFTLEDEPAPADIPGAAVSGAFADTGKDATPSDIPGARVLPDLATEEARAATISYLRDTLGRREVAGHTWNDRVTVLRRSGAVEDDWVFRGFDPKTGEVYLESADGRLDKHVPLAEFRAYNATSADADPIEGGEDVPSMGEIDTLTTAAKAQGFDPERELELVKAAPKAERPALLVAYKEKLMWQKRGLAEAQAKITEAIRANPEMTAEEFQAEWDALAGKFDATPAQKSIAAEVFARYQEKHQAVRGAREQYPDDKALFKAAFGFEPRGNIEVVEGPMTLMFRMHDKDDYAEAYAGRGVVEQMDAPPEWYVKNKENAKNTGGALIASGVFIPKLNACTMIEKVTSRTTDKWSKEVFVHEEQHAINRIFEEQESAFADSAMREMRAKSASDPDAFRSAYAQVLRRAVYDNILPRAKDEIFAFMKEGSSAEKTLRSLLLRGDEGGLYEFLKEPRAKNIENAKSLLGDRFNADYERAANEAAERVFGPVYEQMLRSGLDTIESLRRAGLSEEGIRAVLYQEPLESWTKAAQRFEKTERVTPGIAQRAEEGFRKEFGFSDEDLTTLRKMDGFDALSEEKQMLVLENLRQMSLGRVAVDAEDAYREGIAKERSQTNFLGRMWVGLREGWLMKDVKTRKLKKASEAELRTGGLAAHEVVLKNIIAEVAKGPEVVMAPDGKFEIKYASEIPDLGEKEQLSVSRFNMAATEWSKIPRAWALETAGKAERKKCAEAKELYDATRREFFNAIKDKIGEDNIDAYMAGIDQEVNADRLIATDPDAAEALKGIRDQGVWTAAIKSKIAERGAYFLAGGALRGALTGILGVVGGPAIAAIAAIPATSGAIGAYTGWKRSKGALQERDALAFRGVKDQNKETAMNFVSAEQMAKRLSDLTESVSHYDDYAEDAAGLREGHVVTKIGVKSKERLMESLNERIRYVEEKLAENKVSFGDATHEHFNYNELRRALAEAQMVADESVTGRVGARLDRYLSYREGAIAKRRKWEIRKAITTSAIAGAAFGFAGSQAWARLFGGGGGGTPPQPSPIRGGGNADELVKIPPPPAGGGTSAAESAATAGASGTVGAGGGTPEAMSARPSFEIPKEWNTNPDEGTMMKMMEYIGATADRRAEILSETGMSRAEIEYRIGAMGSLEHPDVARGATPPSGEIDDQYASVASTRGVEEDAVSSGNVAPSVGADETTSAVAEGAEHFRAVVRGDTLTGIAREQIPGFKELSPADQDLFLRGLSPEQLKAIGVSSMDPDRIYADHDEINVNEIERLFAERNGAQGVSAATTEDFPRSEVVTPEPVARVEVVQSGPGANTEYVASGGAPAAELAAAMETRSAESARIATEVANSFFGRNEGGKYVPGTETPAWKGLRGASMDEVLDRTYAPGTSVRLRVVEDEVTPEGVVVPVATERTVSAEEITFLQSRIRSYEAMFNLRHESGETVEVFLRRIAASEQGKAGIEGWQSALPEGTAATMTPYAAELPHEDILEEVPIPRVESDAPPESGAPTEPYVPRATETVPDEPRPPRLKGPRAFMPGERGGRGDMIEELPQRSAPRNPLPFTERFGDGSRFSREPQNFDQVPATRIFHRGSFKLPKEYLDSQGRTHAVTPEFVTWLRNRSNSYWNMGIRPQVDRNGNPVESLPQYFRRAEEMMAGRQGGRPPQAPEVPRVPPPAPRTATPPPFSRQPAPAPRRDSGMLEA